MCQIYRRCCFFRIALSMVFLLKVCVHAGDYAEPASKATRTCLNIEPFSRLYSFERYSSFLVERHERFKKFCWRLLILLFSSLHERSTRSKSGR